MWNVEELKVGRVTSEKIIGSKFNDVCGIVQVIQESTRHTLEEKQVIIQETRENLANIFEGQVCSRYSIVAEPERAEGLAEEETARVLDLLKLYVPALYQSNVLTGIGGEAGRRRRNALVIAHDSSHYFLNGKLLDKKPVTSIQNFEIYPETIN